MLLLLWLLTLSGTDAQFAEIASLATSFLGPALSGATNYTFITVFKTIFLLISRLNYFSGGGLGGLAGLAGTAGQAGAAAGGAAGALGQIGQRKSAYVSVSFFIQSTNWPRELFS